MLLAVSGMKTFAWLAFALSFCACAAPAEEDAEQSGAVGEASSTKRVATCSAKWAEGVIIDEPRPVQEFDLVVEPGAAAELQFVSQWETFSAHVTSPDGQTRSAQAGPKRLRYPLLANTWKEPKRYAVRVERTMDERRGRMRVNCYPIVDADVSSGALDHALCKVGAPCVRSKSGAVVAGVCDNRSRPNVVDDTSLGTCER
jgi:hypothetical protein